MTQIGRKITVANRQRLQEIVVAREMQIPVRDLAAKYGITAGRIYKLYRYGVYLRQQGKL